MEPDYKKEIEEIINGMKCPEDFKCCERRFEALCGAKDIGIESFLQCLEENPRDCKASLPFADIYLCKCPVRVHICKKLGK